MIDLSQAENQVQCVDNFKDLVSSPFYGKVNATCWTRELSGDFSEIVDMIELTENIATLDHEQIHELDLSDQGQLARRTLLSDFNLLQKHGASPVLNLIKAYDKDDSYPFFPTDVYSWHVDRAPVPSATILCTYHGTTSEIIPNSLVKQKVLIPEIRAELKKLYGKKDEKGFDSFLRENFFDLHYQAKPNAVPLNLGVGYMWRLAIDHPVSPVPPCVHRAPFEKDGKTRLMMIC